MHSKHAGYSIEAAGNRYLFDAATHTVTVHTADRVWTQEPEFAPQVSLIPERGKRQTLLFRDALDIQVSEYDTGAGYGMRVRYSGWRLDGKTVEMELETISWVHKTTGHVYFELIPIREPVRTGSVKWPVPWQWNEQNDDSYTVFPMMQGTLIPSNWPVEFQRVGHPHLCAMGVYMPWIGQVSRGSGCLQIVETPWNCADALGHPAGGPTRYSLDWQPSLGYLAYKRVVRNEFFSHCDYNTLCKAYRRYVKERGRLVTLTQKEAANPKVTDLIGSPIIHSHIYFYIKPEAYIYKEGDEAYNYRFATFQQRAREIEALAHKGLKKAYFHLDGWGKDGYDQQHPDILPPCEAAGGAPAMRRLAETCKKHNVLFALHDQYRDYYLDAETFSADEAVWADFDEIPGECTWNGGEQRYLCASLAQRYIERNYLSLEQMGIYPDGVYLDVFAATIPDECFHPEHRMTRRECVEYRAGALEFLRSRGIIASSEVGVDILLPNMDLVHHAPYSGTYAENDNMGVPVPLLNLVYHDFLVTPWAITHESGDPKKNTELFLQAVLNGGPAYLSITADEAEIERCGIVAELSAKVARSEMTEHTFLNAARTIHRTVFSCGISVTVDFDKGEYEITEGNVARIQKKAV